MNDLKIVFSSFLFHWDKKPSLERQLEKVWLDGLQSQIAKHKIKLILIINEDLPTPPYSNFIS
jgi:hypothetical protein